MLFRFNPDAVKQTIKAAATRALEQFRSDLLRHRQIDWFTAAVATGAAKDYRLGCNRLLTAWRETSDHDVVTAAKDSLTKIRDAEAAPNKRLVDWTQASTSNEREGAVATTAVENRMALQLAMHGLQEAIDLRHRSGTAASESEASSSAILAFARELSALDERLHHKLIMLSSAARTETLVAMRSLMRPRDFLPWWLDGTLETVSAAQAVVGEKRARLNAIVEHDPADPEFLQLLVPAIDGQSATIGRPCDRIAINGSSRDVYAWTLHDGDSVAPTRIELLAPAPGGRSKVLELRVAEAVSVAADRSPSRGDEDEAERFVADNSFLAGRAMLLNGIVFLWFRSGPRVTAKVTMGTSPALPLQGRMQLFDCSTNRVLNPVSPA